MKLLMLGCGTSTGVPRIDGDWGACDPADPRNHRTRVSVILENDAKQRVLIDTSPDLRSQLLRHDIDRVDAVLWTHDHADHCHGIDDLRVMRYGRSNPLPGYASEATAGRLRRRFDYVFEGQHGYPTLCQLQPLSVRLIAGFGIDWVEMPHGPTWSTGYRFEADGKTIVYATDFSAITSEMTRCFADADLIVSDCLRREPHPSHAHLAMATELKAKTKARRMVLTHLDKSMDYASLAREVPKGIVVGYDGLEMSL